MFAQVSNKYPLAISVLGGYGTASLVSSGTRLEASLRNVAGYLALGDTPVLAFAGERPAVQLEWHRSTFAKHKNSVARKGLRAPLGLQSLLTALYKMQVCLSSFLLSVSFVMSVAVPASGSWRCSTGACCWRCRAGTLARLPPCSAAFRSVSQTCQVTRVSPAQHRWRYGGLSAVVMCSCQLPDLTLRCKLFPRRSALEGRVSPALKNFVCAPWYKRCNVPLCTEASTVTDAGQLVVRCASGTLWYDGWCLDSRSSGLVVEFQDQQMQLSARDLAACLAKEGGEHASVTQPWRQQQTRRLRVGRVMHGRMHAVPSWELCIADEPALHHFRRTALCSSAP